MEQTGVRVLRLREVSRIIGLRKSAIYDLVKKDPSFPRQIKIGVRASGWLQHELEAWIERRAAERDQGGRA